MALQFYIVKNVASEVIISVYIFLGDYHVIIN